MHKNLKKFLEPRDLKNPVTIVLDTETNWSHDKLHCIGWTAIGVGVSDSTFIYFNPEAFDGVLHTVKKADRSIILVGHNILGFDKKILENFGIYFSQYDVTFIDTLVLSRLVYTDRTDHSLEAWGKDLGIPKLEVPQTKEFFEKYTPEMGEYCKKDVLVCKAIYKHILGEWKADFNYASTLEHRVQDALKAMRDHGMLLDVPYTENLRDSLLKKQEELTDQLQEAFPPKSEVVKLKTKTKIVTTPFNPGSRQQIGERLMEKGWKPTEFTPTGQPKVDETTLAKVDIPEAKLIAEYLMLDKRIGMLTSWLSLVDDNSRVHCYIIGNGAVTGRATHVNPNLGQVVAVGSAYGEEFRRCWIASLGKKLVGTDLDGIEGRIMAHYMQDQAYTLIILNGDKANGTDLHSFNMRGLLLTEDQINKQARDVAKTTFYAMIYGAGMEKLGMIMGCSKEEAARRVDNLFNKALPAFGRLKAKVLAAAKRGYLKGLDGRRVKVRSMHSALNTLFQSGGAIVAKVWLVLCWEAMQDLNKKVGEQVAIPVMWVHDEIQAEVTEGYEDIVSQIMVDKALEAGIICGIGLPTPAEAKVGNNWYETH